MDGTSYTIVSQQPLQSQTLTSSQSEQPQPSPEPTFNNADIGNNLIAIQNHLYGLSLMPSSRQQLQLLLQRQHIEYEELKLRHFLELEKFLKQQKEEMNPTQVNVSSGPPATCNSPPTTNPSPHVDLQSENLQMISNQSAQSIFVVPISAPVTMTEITSPSASPGNLVAFDVNSMGTLAMSTGSSGAGSSTDADLQETILTSNASNTMDSITILQQ